MKAVCFDRRPLFRLVPLAAILVAWTGHAADPPKAAPTPSFEQVAKPLLAKYCVDCHGPKKQSGSLDLHTIKSVKDDHMSWESVLEKLRAGEMPPKKKPQPTADEKKQFLGWLEGELANSTASVAPNPGRVTLRRLNRAEYDNTIRDLLGLDIQPAEDFPVDDVGYGFDNIGDVLAVSPLLFEKYLGAAERIVDKAFTPEVVPFPKNVLYRGFDLQATAKADVFRERAKVFTEGELFVNHKFAGDGTYLFKVRAYGAVIDDERVQIAVTVDGRQVFKRDLPRYVPGQGNPPIRDFKVPELAGTHRVAVTILNPKTNPQEPDERKRSRAVVFSTLEIQGPMPAVERVPTEAYKRIMVAQPGPGVSESDAARRILEPLARRAFRRPVTKAEVDKLVKFVELAKANGDSFEKGIQLAVQAVLVSPHFLFKVERDRAGEKPYSIAEHELATRLSYFLWSSMPDDELMRLADRGELRTNLEPQVRRMLKDPKSAELGDNFAGQWLQVRNVPSIMIDPALFPALDDDLRAAMARETTMFFDAIVKEDRPIGDFIDGDFTFLNERLAKHYGIAGVSGPEFRRVSLKGTPRAGILTQASVLMVTSNATRTSPVKRGKYILDNLLNAPPPPPPPQVPELKDVADRDATGPLRQRMEQHRTNPDCAVCHEKMDSLGFAFENFDAIGRWRTKDGRFDIDPAGTLPDGRTFRDPAELRALLRSEPEKFRRCLAEKLLTYALGRGVEAGDRQALDAICKAAAEHGDTVSELVLAVVKSDPFQMRTPSPQRGGGQGRGK